MEKKGGGMIMPIIISAIVLALSLLIGLYFFGKLSWYGAIDREACHDSIVQRATFRAGPFDVGPRAIPLQCKTEKVCVSESGENCKEFPLKSRDNPITEIEVKGGENAKLVVLDAISDAMYDCHNMLGEGKINFMPHKTWSTNYCLICNRIAFDDKLKNDVPYITYGELYRHLQQKKDSDGRVYLSYIYPGAQNWEFSRVLFDEIKKQNVALSDKNFEDWKIDLNQENGYAIVAQMHNEGRFTQYVASASVAGVVVGASIAAVFTGGLSLLTIPAAIGVLSTGTVAAGALGGITYIITTPDGSKYVAPTILPYDVQTLRSLECSSFETAPT